MDIYMTDETLDKLLQEFLIHKDPAPLKEYMARDGVRYKQSKSVDSIDADDSYSLVSDHSFVTHEPQSEEDSERTTRLKLHRIL